MKDHDSVGLDFKDFPDQAVLALGKLHMRAVVAFGFKAFRKSGKDDSLIRIAGCFNGLGGQCFIVNVFRGGETLRISDLSNILNRVQSAVYPEAVYMRAAAALITGCFGKASDKGDLFCRF